MSTRKGITPVIAIVLLLMMTVAAAGMAYVWVRGVQEDTQKSVGDTLKTKTEQMSGEVTIDNVYENGTADVFLISVRNTGTVTFTSNVLTYAGPKNCTQVNINAPGSSALSTCPYTGGLIDALVFRVVPPKGAAVSATCSIRGTGNDQYCVL